MNCALCHSEHWSDIDFRYVKCGGCHAYVLRPQFWLDKLDEKSRYLEHNNDVNDQRFQDFVKPITQFILSKARSKSAKILDFGSGSGPVISHVLELHGYNPIQYDPFFAKHPDVLDEQYDFIAACEVVEHFHRPRFEYQRLFDILKEGGFLILKTSLYTSEINFETWRYRRDPTHVFIHHKLTIDYIESQWNWHCIECSSERIIFQKSAG